MPRGGWGHVREHPTVDPFSIPDVEVAGYLTADPVGICRQGT